MPCSTAVRLESIAFVAEAGGSVLAEGRKRGRYYERSFIDVHFLAWAYDGSPNREVWPAEVTVWPRD